MADLRKVRAQLLNVETNEVEEDVNVMTAPEAVLFNDGKNLSEKLETIQLTPGPKGDMGVQGIPGIAGAQGSPGVNGAQGAQGLKGDKGDTGVSGTKGDKGDKGEPGDNVKVGADLATAGQKKLFFKVV